MYERIYCDRREFVCEYLLNFIIIGYLVLQRVIQLRYCSMLEAIAIVQHLIRGYFFRCDQSFIY